MSPIDSQSELDTLGLDGVGVLEDQRIVVGRIHALIDQGAEAVSKRGRRYLYNAADHPLGDHLERLDAFRLESRIRLVEVALIVQLVFVRSAKRAAGEQLDGGSGVRRINEPKARARRRTEAFVPVKAQTSVKRQRFEQLDLILGENAA